MRGRFIAGLQPTELYAVCLSASVSGVLSELALTSRGNVLLLVGVKSFLLLCSLLVTSADEPPGRFHLISATVDVFVNEQTIARHALFRIDTHTGETWQYLETLVVA